MPVTLPTAADVRKVREQAAKNAAERAEAARTPLLAVLGAGDAAVTVVTKAIVDAQTRRRAQADKVQAYVTALPQKLNADEARKTVAELREQAGTAYAEFRRARREGVGQDPHAAAGQGRRSRGSRPTPRGSTRASTRSSTTPTTPPRRRSPR